MTEYHKVVAPDAEVFQVRAFADAFEGLKEYLAAVKEGMKCVEMKDAKTFSAVLELVDGLDNAIFDLESAVHDSEIRDLMTDAEWQAERQEQEDSERYLAQRKSDYYFMQVGM